MAESLRFLHRNATTSLKADEAPYLLAMTLDPERPDVPLLSLVPYLCAPLVFQMGRFFLFRGQCKGFT
jgi:hypothetical protein